MEAGDIKVTSTFPFVVFFGLPLSFMSVNESPVFSVRTFCFGSSCLFYYLSVYVSAYGSINFFLSAVAF